MKILQSLFIFFAKSFIFIVTFFLVSSFFIPNVAQLKSDTKDFFSNKANQAMLLSFIQNPKALSIAADRDIFREKYNEAHLKLELALGLLEMHGASQELIKKYELSINAIEQKIEAKKST